MYSNIGRYALTLSQITAILPTTRGNTNATSLLQYLCSNSSKELVHSWCECVYLPRMSPLSQPITTLPTVYGALECSLLVFYILITATDTIMYELLPIVYSIFPVLLLHHGDKSNSIRELASAIVLKFAENASEHVFRALYPVITIMLTNDHHTILRSISSDYYSNYSVEGKSEALILDSNIDWRVKVGTLTVLKTLASRSALHVSPILPHLIPLVSISIIFVLLVCVVYLYVLAK